MLRWALQLGRTPRDLLASVTSEDIVEMIAFDQLEPMGALPMQFAFGQVCATIANVRRPAKQKPFRPENFFPALAREVGDRDSDEPILLDDPEAQSALIKRAILGVV